MSGVGWEVGAESPTPFHLAPQLDKSQKHLTSA